MSSADALMADEFNAKSAVSTGDEVAFVDEVAQVASSVHR